MQRSSPVWMETSPAQNHPMLPMIFPGKISPTLSREIIAQRIAKNAERMNWILRSQCPVAAGLWGVQEPHSLYCRPVPAHSLRKASRQKAFIGSTVCKEGRTAAKARMLPDSMALCIFVGFQAAAPPVNVPQPEGTGKIRAKLLLPVTA